MIFSLILIATMAAIFFGCAVWHFKPAFNAPPSASSTCGERKTAVRSAPYAALRSRTDTVFTACQPLAVAFPTNGNY